MYKHADLRPWDPRNDVCQYEYNYVIQTKTRHQTPMIRTASIVSVDPQAVVSFSVLFSSLKQCSPKGYFEYINLLNPTGHVMHQQFNIQQLYILPTLYLCVLCLYENKQRLMPLTS